MSVTTRAGDDALRQLLSRQLEVITRRQALAAGVTASSLRHRLGPGNSWQSVIPGVYLAATGTPTIIQQQMAAMLHAGRGSVITGPAALQQHRIRGPAVDLIDVLIPASRRRRDAAFVRLHRTTRMPKRIWRFGPLYYALPGRAVADTVRGLTSLRDVRAVVADAVQRDACTVPDLSTELDHGPRGWPEKGVAVEVDSHEWHMSPHDHTRTLERQRRMGKRGILVLPFTPREIRTQPAKVMATIRDALKSGRRPDNIQTKAA
jgi:hypothetical protein